MKRVLPRWLWVLALPLPLLLSTARAWSQEPFDFEAFGRNIGEAQALYNEARALGEGEADLRRELLIQSADAQQRAIDLLHTALVGGAFSGSDRDEAEVRLLELNTAVIVIRVEVGRCSQAQGQLTAVLAEPGLLPPDGPEALAALRPSVATCEERVAQEPQPVEPGPVEPGPVEPESPAEGVPAEEAEGPQALALAPEADVGPPGEPAPVEPAQPLVTAAWVPGSLGLACLVTAGAFYWNSSSLQDDLDAEVARSRFDPATAQSIWSDLETSDAWLNGFLWTGVGLVATSAVLAGVALLSDEPSVGAVALPEGAAFGVGWAF
jgi:hypothetical protein